MYHQQWLDILDKAHNDKPECFAQFHYPDCGGNVATILSCLDAKPGRLTRLDLIFVPAIQQWKACKRCEKGVKDWRKQVQARVDAATKF